MPRLVFNTTCDVYCGPDSATPNVLRGTVPCRFVLQHGIKLVGSNAPVRTAWITMEGIQPTGVWDFPMLKVRPGKADRIAVPSGSAAAYWVLYTERVIWKGQPTYYRANVAALPASPFGCDDEECDCDDLRTIGGIVIGGPARYTHPALGGIVIGGETVVTLVP